MSGFAAFLAEDFQRIGEPWLSRARAIDGHRLVLSGATGFFGSNLLALLACLHDAGARFEVSAFSREPERFFAAHPWAARLPWLQMARGDAREPWPVQGAHSLLLHAATDTHASAHRDAAAVFEHELAAARQALQAAQACGVRRLLLTGSGAQYGAITPGPDGQGVDESSAAACDPLRPGSAYGEGKRVAELLAALQAQRSGCALVATRGFAFVGPGLPLDGHFAIGNFMGDALAGRPLRLTSDGSAVRSWLYGADLALWLLLLLLEAPGGTAVNVGSDEACRVRDAAERVRRLIAPALTLQLGEPVPGEPRSFYLPSIARARALGLEVWTSLDAAIQRTAAWHRRTRSA